MASQENHVEVIKMLLASGAKINLGRKVRILLTVGDSDYIAANYYMSSLQHAHKSVLSQFLCVVACSMCPTSFSPYGYSYQNSEDVPLL